MRFWVANCVGTIYGRLVVFKKKIIFPFSIDEFAKPSLELRICPTISTTALVDFGCLPHQKFAIKSQKAEKNEAKNVLYCHIQMKLLSLILLLINYD